MESESGITEKVVEFKDLDVLTRSELLSNRNHEELRKVEHRIQLLEDQFGHLHDSMVELNHSKTQLRDTGDGFGLVLTQFGLMDQSVSTTNYSMKLLGDAVFSIGDKMDSEINLFEHKILPIFVAFGAALKGMKSQWHLANQAEARHSAKRTEYAKYMEKVKTSDESHHREKEQQLRGKLNQRMTDSSLFRRKCVKKFAKLETKRAEDLKKIVTKWFRAQAAVAAKTLELSTQACQTAMSIDVLGDYNKLINDLNLEASVGSIEDLESDEDVHDEGAGYTDDSYYLNESFFQEVTFVEDKDEKNGCGDSNFKKVDRQGKNKEDRGSSQPKPKQKHRKS